MNPVQSQLDAYNARDLEAFLVCYAADTIIEDAHGNVLANGHDAMRALYSALFAQSPNLRCEVGTRIEAGAYVIDEESVTGVNLAGFPESIHAAVVFRVEQGMITHVRVLM